MAHISTYIIQDSCNFIFDSLHVTTLAMKSHFVGRTSSSQWEQFGLRSYKSVSERHGSQVCLGHISRLAMGKLFLTYNLAYENNEEVPTCYFCCAD